MHADVFPENRYGPSFDRLLAGRPMACLGPGQANRSVETNLRALSSESAFAPAIVRDREMANACLAGIWLYHDFLEESHRISQNIATPSGSFWHAIMHRREPDAWNSKYWFKRVGTHPIFEALGARALELPGATAEPLLGANPWDPFAFVDACERARGGNQELAELCQHTQALEWNLLFDFCYRRAIGQPS